MIFVVRVKKTKHYFEPNYTGLYNCIKTKSGFLSTLKRVTETV